MADHTEISWTDATWNPTSGCTKVSPGCAHCYIERTPPMRMAGRKFVGGKIPLELHENRLMQPLKWKKPRRIFVNSMSDLFHEDVPNEFIANVFSVMYEAQWHTYQVLTKRAERMQSLLSNPRFPYAVGCLAWTRLKATAPEKAAVVTVEEMIRDVENNWPLRQVWLGASVEDQQRADERIPLLLQTPAAVRFLSCEPLLGPVELSAFFGGEYATTTGSEPNYNFGIDWVIVGGESGPGSRPFDLAWARSLRDQCQAANVPFFFKQAGSNPFDTDAMRNVPGADTVYPTDAAGNPTDEMLDTLGECLEVGTVRLKDKKGSDMEEFPEDLCIRQFPDVPCVVEVNDGP